MSPRRSGFNADRARHPARLEKPPYSVTEFGRHIRAYQIGMGDVPRQGTSIERNQDAQALDGGNKGGVEIDHQSTGFRSTTAR